MVREEGSEDYFWREKEVLQRHSFRRVRRCLPRYMLHTGSELTTSALKRWLSQHGVNPHPKRGKQTHLQQPQQHLQPHASRPSPHPSPAGRALQPFNFDASPSSSPLPQIPHPSHHDPSTAHAHVHARSHSALDNLFHRFIDKQEQDLDTSSGLGTDNKAGLERLFGNLNVLKHESEATTSYNTTEQSARVDQAEREKREDDALVRLLGGLSTATPAPPAPEVAPLPPPASEKAGRLLALLNPSSLLPASQPVAAQATSGPQANVKPHQASLLAMLSPTQRAPTPASIGSGQGAMHQATKPMSLPTSPKPPSPTQAERARRQRALLEQITAGIGLDIPSTANNGDTSTELPADSFASPHMTQQHQHQPYQPTSASTPGTAAVRPMDREQSRESGSEGRRTVAQDSYPPPHSGVASAKVNASSGPRSAPPPPYEMTSPYDHGAQHHDVSGDILPQVSAPQFQHAQHAQHSQHTQHHQPTQSATGMLGHLASNDQRHHQNVEQHQLQPPQHSYPQQQSYAANASPSSDLFATSAGTGQVQTHPDARQNLLNLLRSDPPANTANQTNRPFVQHTMNQPPNNHQGKGLPPLRGPVQGYRPAPPQQTLPPQPQLQPFQGNTQSFSSQPQGPLPPGMPPYTVNNHTGHPTHSNHSNHSNHSHPLPVRPQAHMPAGQSGGYQLPTSGPVPPGMGMGYNGGHVPKPMLVPPQQGPPGQSHGYSAYPANGPGQRGNGMGSGNMGAGGAGGGMYHHPVPRPPNAQAGALLGLLNDPPR